MKEELEGALSEAKKERVPIDSIPESQQIELDNLIDSAKLDLEDRIGKRKWRRAWGLTLLILVCFGFVCSYAIVILIGAHVLSFPESQFAVPSVVAAGVIGTYGLAKIAVKYFFSD